MPWSNWPSLEAALDRYAGGDETKKLELLYGMLDIVDTKSATLLQFNGLLIAGIAILIPQFDTNLRVLGLAFIVLNILVCGLSFLAVRIKWPFLRVELHGQTEIAQLCEVVDARTRLYKAAWWATLVLSALLIVIVLAYLWATVTS
jgi:hypothetical protein